MIKVTPSISTTATHGVLYSDGGIISVVFLPQVHNDSLNLRIKDQPKLKGITRWHRGTESACLGWRCRLHPWVGKILWRREWQHIPVFLPGKSHGQGHLVGHSPTGSKELATTEQHASCIYQSTALEPLKVSRSCKRSNRGLS